MELLRDVIDGFINTTKFHAERVVGICLKHLASENSMYSVEELKLIINMACDLKHYLNDYKDYAFDDIDEGIACYKGIVRILQRMENRISDEISWYKDDGLYTELKCALDILFENRDIDL